MSEHESIESKEEQVFEVWDNSRRAKAVIIVFWIFVGSSIFILVSTYAELGLLNKIAADEYIEDGAILASEDRLGLASLVHLIVFIASIVVFIQWFRRAYGNLERSGVPYVAHRETMTIWAWIIPIVFLYRPLQMMNEIWKESQERIHTFDQLFVIRNIKPVVGVWWAIHILSHIIGQFEFRQMMNEYPSTAELISAAQFSLVSSGVELFEALMVILIVSQITKMEDKLAEEIVKSGGNLIKK